jgi:hypothetical protein
LSLINFNYFTLLIKDYYYFCYKLFQSWIVRKIHQANEK